MSRLIITNLPSKVSQEDIKKHFSKKGNVTDVKLVYKNGEFRRYGFVGFEKEEDAKDACHYFNNTYIKQAKVTVEMCQDFKNEAKPFSWREKNKLRKEAATEVPDDYNDVYTTISEDKIKKKKSAARNIDNIIKQHENDEDFKDFMKTRKELEKKSEIIPVATDEVKKEEKVDVEDDEGDTDTKVADKKNVSDLDYLKSLMVSSKSEDAAGGTEEQNKQISQITKDLYQVVIRTKERCKIRQKGSVGFTKRSVKDFIKPLKYQSLRIPKKMKFVAYVGFKTEREMKRALHKDKSFLNGARVQVVKYEKRDEEQNHLDQRNAPWSAAEERVKTLEPVGESGKLFVRNLWYSVTEDDLRELFEQYGKVAEITLPICKITRRSKGFATVMFMFPEHSVRAMTELDGTSYKGRILHILPARKDEDDNDEKEGEGFKDKKAREQKATAGSWHNWNTLFLGSSAVIDIMAEKYNKSKHEILHSEGKQSVAVNLALGESQIVDETRRFMEDNGIALDAFTSPGVQRSNTVILVKNLPANTTAQELTQIFSRYGELGRVVLPPAGVTGIIEYLDPGEAKKGFRNLAYTKFHYLPLYLEWAPQKVFKTECVVKAKPYRNNKAEHMEEVTVTSNDATESTENFTETPKALPDPEPETTVYVKNLNFTTTEEVLKEHFNKVGTIHTVLIAKRRGLSQGYGFIQFVRQCHTQKALREMQETLLEEKYLQLKLSEKTLVTPVKSTRIMHDIGKQTSTKILVKNIPFEATPREVRQLFATFGELKTVRLPKKPNNTEHRGFGFVDFVTQGEAKKAFEALCHSTHLYDRRLVLEWAKDDETVEELRAKTAQEFLRSGPPLKKKRIAESLDSTTAFNEDDD